MFLSKMSKSRRLTLTFFPTNKDKLHTRKGQEVILTDLKKARMVPDDSLCQYILAILEIHCLSNYGLTALETFGEYVHFSEF